MIKASLTRTIIPYILCIVLFIALLPVYAAAPSIADLSEQDGIITVSLSEKVEGKISIVLYQGASAVYQNEQAASSAQVQIPLPVRRLPKGDYTATIFFTDNNGNASEIRSLSIKTGTDTPIDLGGGTYVPYPSQTPATSRAVMVPYAKLYASDSMVGEPLAELKRHDLVSVISDNGTVSYVKCIVQSGNGTITHIDKTNAEYSSPDDLVVTGYMYNSSFSLPLTTIAPDLQREVVELAYSRLGLKGVYSQAKRYVDYYTDCSALASWCWYQVGVDFTNYGTSCNGIASWAKSQRENVILWDGGEEPVDFEDYKDDNGITEDLTFTGTSFDGELSEESIVTYTQTVDQGVFESLKPGDLIFFNYARDIEDQFGGAFHYPVNEDSYGVTSMGLDHVAIFVGQKSPTTITVIEASSPTTNPGDNTKLSEITLSGSKAQQIVQIIRPAGCA